MTSSSRTADERAKRVWSLGSYADIAPVFLPMAAHLVDTVDPCEGDSVLDVACGTGNVALTAARRGAEVTGLDLVPGMLEMARENARIADLDITWREGSATDLPFEDGRFDITLSCVGHMFADPPDRAGRELCRVTRSGGRVAFTSWTPESVVPTMGAVLATHLPENPDAPAPPFLWGDPAVIEDRIGTWTADVRFESDLVLTPVVSPAHYWEQAITESGMFIAALEMVDDVEALREETIAAIEPFFDDERNVMPMEYRITTAKVTTID